MSKRFYKYFLDVPICIPEPSLLEAGPGPCGKGLSVHHWTEISISIPKIVTEIRTLNVLWRKVSVIYSSLAGRDLSCPDGNLRLKTTRSRPLSPINYN